MKSFPTRTVRHLLAAAAAACVAGGAFATPTTWSATRTQAADTRGLAAGASVAADMQIHVTVSLRLRNEAELDTLVDAILEGSSHEHLTREQAQERHSPTAEQAEAVAAYLRQSGFANVEIASNRMLVSADGSAAAIQSAFDTTLRHFASEGRDTYANESAARVPAALGAIVNAVHGLDTLHKPHLDVERFDASRSVVPDTVVGHAPKEFATIYDADSLPTAANTTIAIMTGGNITQTFTDFTAYLGQNGYTAPKIKQVVVGTAGSDTSGTLEWDLDSQTSFAVAGAAVKELMFYTVNNVQSIHIFVAGFNQAVADDEAQIVNASLGLCEIGEESNGDISAIDASFKVGIAQGQTFTISSGDSGAQECNATKIGEEYPAVSPYSTAIGGTTLSTDNQTQYNSETTWSRAGGGPSINEAEPKYQKKAVGKLSGRGIPDISFSADPASGAILVINGGNGHEQVGGTSLSAPMFMGFWARIQSMNGNTLVSPNAAIYKYTQKAKDAKLYTHDVTTGSNGYPAGPGWDFATGYGSLDIADFAAFVGTHPGF